MLIQLLFLMLNKTSILSAREILFYGGKLTFDSEIKLKQGWTIRFFETFSIQGLSGDATIELRKW